MQRPEKILANDLLELEVLDLGAGVVVGSIVDFALTQEGKVELIGILGEQWFKGGQGIAPSAITNLNLERITIANSDVLTEFCPDGETLFSANTDQYILGKRVMQEDGEMLGILQDFSLCLEDGQITDLIVLGGDEKRVKIPVESFKTIGRDYIVIVRGTQDFETPEEVPTSAEPGPAVKVELAKEAKPDDAVVDVGIPPKAKDVEDALPQPVDEPSRTEEKQALFGDKKERARLSKFDKKKHDFLMGKTANRDINDAEGKPILAKDQNIDEAALEQIISAGMLGDIFIELTLKK